MNKRAGLPAVALSGQPQIKAPISPVALKNWHQSADAKVSANTEINIFGVVGDGYWSDEPITPTAIQTQLKAAAGADVTININSPGGSAFDGLAIYNLLRAYSGTVTVNVLGLAASAASIIAMGGDVVRIAKAGMLMIHNSRGLCAGTAEDMRDTAAAMDKLDSLMVGIYATRTGAAESDIKALMHRADHYMTGQEAIDAGYADALLSADQDTPEPATEPLPIAAVNTLRLAAMAQDANPPTPQIPTVQSEEIDMDLQQAQARIAELEQRNAELEQASRTDQINALAEAVALTDEQKTALTGITDTNALTTAIGVIKATASKASKVPQLPTAMSAPLVGAEPAGTSLDDKFNAFMKGA